MSNPSTQDRLRYYLPAVDEESSDHDDLLLLLNPKPVKPPPQKTSSSPAETEDAAYTSKEDVFSYIQQPLKPTRARRGFGMPSIHEGTEPNCPKPSTSFFSKKPSADLHGFKQKRFSKHLSPEGGKKSIDFIVTLKAKGGPKVRHHEPEASKRGQCKNASVKVHVSTEAEAVGATDTRRALRVRTRTNYKEPSLHTKMRQPG